VVTQSALIEVYISVKSGCDPILAYGSNIEASETGFLAQGPSA
jgi:hypothetical protein